MNPCYLIADFIHRRRDASGTPSADMRRKDDAAYWSWQQQTSQDYFSKFFDLDRRLCDADVIDIGCGLGGRTCYLASRAVRRIVGTDINHCEIDRASQLASQRCDRRTLEKVSFEKVNEDEGAPRDRRFDVALLVDSLEHVQDPVAMLNLAHSLLKPGGVCYFSTWGWYHHQASHVGSIIPIPFATVLFSDRQIIDAVRRIVDQPYYQRTIWDSDPPSSRWKNCHTLHDRPGEHLNKFTISKFRQSMRASEFSRWQLRVQGFSETRHPWLAAINFLTKVPLIEEVFHSAIFGMLIKTNADSVSGSSASKSPRSSQVAA